MDCGATLHVCLVLCWHAVQCVNGEKAGPVLLDCLPYSVYGQSLIDLAGTGQRAVPACSVVHSQRSVLALLLCAGKKLSWKITLLHSGTTSLSTLR